MALEGFNFIVKSSWVPDSDRQLSGVVSLGSSSDPTQWSEDFPDEIHHEINQENLLHLSTPTTDAPDNPDGDPCTLTIQVDEPCWRITKASVVSQTRIVEVYGPLGEYICTSKGNQISDDPDACLYNSQPDVTERHVRNELTLKFPGAKNHMWIYGVKLLVEKMDEVPSGNVDYLRVDEMLKSSKLPLTDKAEQAKQFLQRYSSMLGAGKQPPPDPKAIFRILESEYKCHMKPVEDASRNVSQYIANFIQAKQNLAKKGDDSSTQSGSKEDAAASSLGDVKAYVDQSMQQLEERVQNNLKIQLQAMEEKQNKKLDAILQLLSQKN